MRRGRYGESVLLVLFSSALSVAVAARRGVDVSVSRGVRTGEEVCVRST